MKKYQVTITETLQMEVEVKADSPAQAEQTIQDNYRACEYFLDADHFKDVDFRTKHVQRNRDYKR